MSSCDERVDLGLVLDAHEAVDGLGLVVDGRHVLVAARVARVGAGDLAGVALERRGEEQRLALARRQRDDAVDGRAEAHVEHPVGLVEDEDLDVLERDRAALEDVLQAAGRGDDDVRAAGALHLALDAGAAVDGGDGQRAGVRDVVHVVDDLQRELARRGEDQRGGAAIGRLEALDDRHGEGERLARAGGRLGEDVVAGEDVRDDERLDGEGVGDAALGEHVAHDFGHAEVGEGLLGGHMAPTDRKAIREIRLARNRA